MLRSLSVIRPINNLFCISLRNVSKQSIPYISEETGINHDLIREQFTEYKDHDSGMVKMKSFSRDVVCPLRAETFKTIKNIEAKGNAISDWPEPVVLLLGEHSMVFQNGEKHRRIRKEFQPFFLDNALRQRYEMLAAQTNNYLNMLYKATSDNPNEYHSNFALSKKWAWNIALKIIFGEDFIDETFSAELLDIFMIWSVGMMDVDANNANIPGTLLGDSLIKRKELLYHMENLVHKSFAYYNERKLDETCVMYKLCENEILSYLSMDELLDQILVLINASHDTTAATANNVLYVLYSFPEIAEQVRNECEKLSKTSGVFDFDELMDNVFLDAFVYEVLRWVPTVPFTSKILLKDENINGYTLDKGTLICLSNVGMSRSPNEFENAYEFNPQRFVEKAANKYDGYVPFGKGIKKCLGWKLALLELKLFSAILTTECTFEVDESRVKQAENFFFFYEIYGKFYKR